MSVSNVCLCGRRVWKHADKSIQKCAKCLGLEGFCPYGCCPVPIPISGFDGHPDCCGPEGVSCLIGEPITR